MEQVKVFNRFIGRMEKMHPATDTEKALLDFIGRNLQRLVTDIKEFTENRPDMDHVMRLRLIVEELGEVALAFANEDRPQQLKELVDLRYVADGFTELAGFSHVFSEAFNRVHASNMSKLGPNGETERDSTGKVLKGPHYRPAVLADLLTTAPEFQFQPMEPVKLSPETVAKLYTSHGA